MRLPALQLVDVVPGAGYLVEVADGPLRRQLFLIPTPRPTEVRRNERRRRPTAAAERRARELLESLLTPSQLGTWQATGTFWVPTPLGPVRLGRLYDLRHRPQPDVERSLCVVPEGHGELPEGDVWTNLLLVLAHDPREFFRVAILNRRQPARAR